MEQVACRTARTRLKGVGRILAHVLPDTTTCEQLRSAYAARYHAKWSAGDVAGELPKWVKDDEVVGVGVSRSVLAQANVSGRVLPAYYMRY